MANKRIIQCEYSEARMGKFFYFLEKYNLKKYFSPYEPAVFFGMYGKLTLETIKKHKGLSIVIWRGTDIISEKKRLESVIKLKNPNIKHIAISSFIANDLKKAKVPYKFIPISATKIEDIEPCKLGNEIYAYASKSRFDFYGGHIVRELEKRCNFKINIVLGSNQYTRDEILELYKKSFIGLRLTQHDGIANQVVEMGIMGRKCIHNGNHPNCIQWDNIDGILKSINIESQNIGQTNYDLAEKVKNYINVNDDWLYTNFWK